MAETEEVAERPLPTTVEEWVKDPRGPIPPGKGAVVDRGLMTPWEAMRGLFRRGRGRETSSQRSGRN